MIFKLVENNGKMEKQTGIKSCTSEEEYWLNVNNR